MQVNFNDYHQFSETHVIDKNLDKKIHQVQGYRQEGFKIAVFVGRSPLEPLPKEKNWIWVSLNPEPEDSYRGQFIHFSVNMNFDIDPKLKYIFDKVILDFDTLKFLSKCPFEKMTHFLSISPVSELILPLENCVSILEDTNECIFYSRSLSYSVPLKLAEPYLEEDDDISPFWISAQEGFEKKVSAFGSNFFSSVEITTSDYPYMDSRGFKRKVPFIVCKGPTGAVSHSIKENFDICVPQLTKDPFCSVF